MLTLTPEELRELTGKRRSDAQRRALNEMGISYVVRPDRSLAVLRRHAEAVLAGGEATIRAPVEPELQP